MTVLLAVHDLAPITRLPKDDCCPGQCERSVTMVRYVLWLLYGDALDPSPFRSGAEVHEAASSVFDPSQGYDADRGGGVFGPTCEARWALLIGDVERAIASGCRTPEQIALALCQFALDSTMVEDVS